MCGPCSSGVTVALGCCNARKAVLPLVPSEWSTRGGMDNAPLEIQQADDPRGLTVRIAGHVDMRAAEALGDRLMPICAKRPPLVVLDLSGVTFIGSMGLGALVTFRKAVIRCAGS